MKYIERDAAIRAVLKYGSQAAVAAIQDLPTVDAVSVEQIESFIDWLGRNGYTVLKKAIIYARLDYCADGERRTE